MSSRLDDSRGGNGWSGGEAWWKGGKGGERMGEGKVLYFGADRQTAYEFKLRGVKNSSSCESVGGDKTHVDLAVSVQFYICFISDLRAQRWWVERERETETETETKRDRDRDRKTETERQSDRKSQRQRHPPSTHTHTLTHARTRSLSTHARTHT